MPRKNRDGAGAGAGLTESEFEAIREQHDTFVVSRSNYADCLHLVDDCTGTQDTDIVEKDVAVYPYGSKPVCSYCWDMAQSGDLRDDDGRFLPAPGD